TSPMEADEELSALIRPPVTPKPESFSDWRESRYSHWAQEIARAAGATLLLRDGSTWLVSSEGERLLRTPERLKRLWFETWTILRIEYPDLCRLTTTTQRARKRANRARRAKRAAKRRR